MSLWPSSATIPSSFSSPWNFNPFPLILAHMQISYPWGSISLLTRCDDASSPDLHKFPSRQEQQKKFEYPSSSSPSHPFVSFCLTKNNFVWLTERIRLIFSRRKEKFASPWRIVCENNHLSFQKSLSDFQLFATHNHNAKYQ